jgi:transcriptional regulator GlxA family with amidase domain
MNRIMHCIQIVDKQKGMVSIDHLADKACLGRKQLERNFKEFIGSTPRQFLKVIRFQNSLFQKSLCKELTITELAHQCGYFDQSHMINDYKELSGMTPGEYFIECDPVSDYFTLNV